MSISLIGIGGLQWFWVKNAISIEENRFDALVNKAMNEVIDELESREALIIVKDQISEDSELNIFLEKAVWKDDEKHFSEELIVIDNQNQNSSGATTFQIKIDDSCDSTLSVDNDTNYNITTIVSHSFKTDSNEIYIKDSLIKKEHPYQLHLVQEVIGDVMVEYLSIEDPLSSRLSGVVLDSFIKEKLDINAIHTPFEYAVTEEENDSIIPEYSSAAFLADGSTYKKDLFQNDLLQKGNTLLISFPDKSTYIMQSMTWIMALVVGFTLFIIATFAFTILNILRQKRLSEVKTEFINNMTHEFKTPLATISIASDSINHPDVIHSPEKIKHFTSLIKEEKKRLNMHVEKVLQVARLEKGELIFNVRNIDINDLVREAVNTMQLQANEKHGKIELILQDDLNLIEGDRFHIQNVVLNLLDNAIKYCLKNPEIKVSTSLKGEGCLLKVSDNGKGMSKDVLKKIFNTFYREESGDQHDVKGFGLGLSYAKAIIEKHQGNIHVNSTENIGTTVEVFIPFSIKPKN